MNSSTSGVAAGNPQPQTTQEASGGPFIRHSIEGRRQQYVSTVQPGGLVAPPTVAMPGWVRGYHLFSLATGNSGTGGVISSGVGGLDAPYSEYSLIQVKDAFGTPLITGPGYEILKLLDLYSGQFGTDETQDIQNFPSWTGMTAASGAWQFHAYIPFEFTKGYGVISGANASLLPTIQMNLAPLSVLFSTAPSTVPTLTHYLESDFYWLPQGVDMSPPGEGTTCQWLFQPCNPTIPSNGTQRVQAPRLGGYLTVVVLDLRDSTGARVDAWPAEPIIYIDNVPAYDTRLQTIYDDMAIQDMVGGGTAGTQTTASTPQTPRPTGTIALSKKTALAQRHFGLFDTGEEFLSTNPGTQIEVSGAPWGTISNAPGTLNVIAGQVVPSGELIQGLPEV
jgi:hypothetical protein